jgi:hypothetical protein
VTHLSSLNKSQAVANTDGAYVYVLSLRDPGVHNWIDPVGLREGWMLLRWQGVPPTTDPATLIRSVTAVKLDDLEAALPAGTPKADIRSRSEQIKARMAEFAVRISS